VLERSVGLGVAGSKGSLVVDKVADGSAADRRGLREGDQILGANGQEVKEGEELGREVLRGLDRGSILLAVRRGRYVYNLEFPL
jgi:S1-C subfamily serine protease